MLSHLRHMRLLTLLLLIGTPGLAGTALSAIHPCAADMPWTATPTEHAAHHGSHDSGPSDGGAPAPCHCIGACQGAAPMVAAGQGTELAVVVNVLLAPRHVVPASDAPVARPSDLLPPKTAPPTLG